MKLYLIRHLITDWNKINRLQGSKDIPISPISKSDLVTIEQRKTQLITIPFDAIIATEKIRTQQTAAAFDYANLQIEPLLNELNFGIFEGKDKALLQEKVGKDWLNNCLTLELGETLIHFQERLYTFIKKYQTHHHVLVFAHGAVIRGLKAIHETGNINTMNTYPSENLSLTILEF